MSEKLVYLLFYSLVTIGDATNLLDKYDQSPGSVYHGRYTRNVHEPELLIPRRVSGDGTFSSYALPKYYDRQEVTERRKRSADSETDKLHLILPFNGVDNHVELSPYHDFISPDMVIETRGPGISKNLNEGLRFTRVPDEQCHYRGHVRGHSNSRAALSLCNGVAGYVQTTEGRYFIEPVSDAEPASDGQHVHMAYRREAPHENDETGSSAGSRPKRRCGTGDNWEEAWAEQLAKRQRRLVEQEKRQLVDGGKSIGSLKREGRKPASGTHSIHRFIEIGLVADRRFLDFHNSTDYEKYLLTIMNMVSDYYHDVSSGNQIDVVVVRMIYLESEKDEIDLYISPKAEKTLDSFSKWADKMNPKDHTHPNHYDIAVLVTRYDICSEDTACDLMGLAYVAAACDSTKAACINEDSGLLLGIVIAHEVGHVMGCGHDEETASGCQPQDKDESYFLMSPIVFIYTIRWSPCSRKFITSFLESGLGECLNDDPRNPPDRFRYPNMLPGAMYDANFQCGLEEPGSSFCDLGKAGNCEQLWCRRGNRCFSKGAPPADGTKCGENKWCIRMKCVDMGARPAAVNGGWGDWGPLSSCSRTCGGGVKSAERECNKPKPANGGRYCIGERRRLSTCNTTPCDPSKPSFRATQCAEFDTKKVLSDGLHKWTPYMRDDLEPCALNCINEKNTFVKLSPSTKDATPCKGGTNYMCISGTCRKVGCDWVIDADTIEDQCGVCKGDGTQCSAVEGDYTKKNVRDYQKVVTIPKGARSIYVTEKRESGNTLAVKTEKDNKYCLNGNHVEQRNGDYPCAGATIIYSHPLPQKEEITIRGPLTEDIQIQCVFYEPRNAGVHYKYYVKSGGSAAYTPKYMWDFTEWGACNAKCGGGAMISQATCIEQQSGAVSATFCQSMPRPEPKSRVCNEKPCPAKWRVSQWSQCSACDGKKGVLHRKVQCVKPSAHPGGDDVQAKIEACSSPAPKQTQECVGQRPCKTMCPKKTRNCEESDVALVPENHGPSLTEQRRMIDKLVDLGIARYLEKSRRQTDIEMANKSVKRDVSEDFKSLLHDWVMIGTEDKGKRTCGNETDDQSITGNFTNQEQQVLGANDQQQMQQQQIGGAQRQTTPQPGSIIKDVVPPSDIVLYEAPLRDELLKGNISDLGFQEGGDSIPMGIDTSKEKVYRGAQAAKIIAELAHQNSTMGNLISGDGSKITITTTSPSLSEGSPPGIEAQGPNKTIVTSTSLDTPNT